MIRDPFDVDAAVEAHQEERERAIREDTLVEIQIEDHRARYEGTPPEADLETL